MTTRPITVEELRDEVRKVLDRHQLTLPEFVAMSLDDVTDDELRDLWLMTHELLARPD